MADATGSYRVGVKLYLKPGPVPGRDELIATFHRWIQSHALPGLLIDVADYTHVDGGPGVMLISHEGHLAFATAGRQKGLTYRRKREQEGGFEASLKDACGVVLAAGVLLEAEKSFSAGVEFDPTRLQVNVEDRLFAPGGPTTQAALQPAIERLAGRLFDGARCELGPAGDAREPYSVEVHCSAEASLSELRDRI